MAGVQPTIHIRTPTSWLATWDNYVSSEKQGELIPKLMSLPLTHRPPLMLYGKEVHANRDIGFFSTDSAGYQYTGQISQSQGLTSELQYILDTVNRDFKIISGQDIAFNGILVNLYRNGEDYIGAHSDKEFSLLEGGYIFALSFGAERIFRIRSKTTKERWDIITKSGQLLCMAGKFQAEFTHEIPVSKRVLQPRISLTFRYHLK
jgi:alkylated DNA repair dioxygenase AlkB